MELIERIKSLSAIQVLLVSWAVGGIAFFVDHEILNSSLQIISTIIFIIAIVTYFKRK